MAVRQRSKLSVGNVTGCLHCSGGGCKCSIYPMQTSNLKAGDNHLDGSDGMRIYVSFKFHVTNALVRLRAWEWEWFYGGFRPVSTGDRRRDEHRRRKARIWLWGLGGACVGLFVLARAIEILSHHAWDGNSSIHVLSRVLWIVYFLVQLVFLAAVAWAIKVRKGPDTPVRP